MCETDKQHFEELHFKCQSSCYELLRLLLFLSLLAAHRALLYWALPVAEALLRVLSWGTHLQDGSLPREAGSEPGSRHAQGDVHYCTGGEETTQKPPGKGERRRYVCRMRKKHLGLGDWQYLIGYKCVYNISLLQCIWVLLHKWSYYQCLSPSKFMFHKSYSCISKPVYH